MSHTATNVRLLLQKVGNPAGRVVVSIRATDAGGLPTGKDLATGTISTAAISAAVPGWYEFDLGAGAALTAGTRYAICMQAPEASSSGSVNTIYYGVDTSNPYPIGTINVTVPRGIDVERMTATFTTSPYTAHVRVDGLFEQISGVTANNFRLPVTYVVTGADGTTTKTWVVTVTQAQ